MRINILIKNNQQQNDMKRSILIFLFVLSLFGIGYGQSKCTPALQQASQNRKSDEKISIMITMASQYDATGLEARTRFMSRKNRTRLVTE